MRFFSRLIATGLYSGYAPLAPGTAGSILALLIYWLIPGTDSIAFIGAIAVIIWLGSWSATQVELDTGIKDNQIIVIDEMAGVFITLFMFEKSIMWLTLGCILFRVFDIVKFYPSAQLEKIPKGWGVMLDDIVAGIYAVISLRLIHWIITKLL